MHLSTSDWGDLITLSILSVMWWTLVAVTLKRTWKWDALGRALTFMSASFAVSTTLGILFVFWDLVLWAAAIRWGFRISGSIAGSFVIGVLIFDKRGPTTDERVADAAERTAFATEVIAEQGVVIKNEREG